MQRIFKLIIALCVLSASGCGGGLNCPIDPPSCCYNELFGCGTFDLPFGCTCEDYGIGFARQNVSSAMVNMSSANNAPHAEEVWSGTLQEKLSSCLSAKRTFSGVILVTESRNKVRVKVPGYGKLLGKKRGRRGFKAAGVYNLPFSQCSLKINAIMHSANARLGYLSTQVKLSCAESFSCSASYAGAFVKN